MLGQGNTEKFQNVLLVPQIIFLRLLWDFTAGYGRMLAGQFYRWQQNLGPIILSLRTPNFE